MLFDVEGVDFELAGRTVGKVMLQCFFDGAKSQLAPRDVGLIEQAGFLGLMSRVELVVGKFC